jgi:hypothetical protein
MAKLKAAAKSAKVGEFAESASFWYVGEFSEGAKKNEESGVYEVPVTLIRPGLSKNKVHYNEGWLSKFASMMEGKKAYLDHEKKSEIKDRQSRSVKDVAGWYSDVHQDDEGAVKGTLNLVETPSTEHVIKLAKANPELVGLSINARGKASRGKINGENAMIAETLEKVYSTDIVTEAAAGGELESMRLVASVLLDVEEAEETNMEETHNTEPTIEEQTTWYRAVWLETERIYQENEMDKATAEWLIAEAGEKARHDALLGAWLDAEKVHEDSQIKAWLDAELGECIKDAPDVLKESFRDMTLEKARDIMDRMRKVLPDKPAKSGGPADPPKPGEEGYKRHFL